MVVGVVRAEEGGGFEFVAVLSVVAKAEDCCIGRSCCSIRGPSRGVLFLVVIVVVVVFVAGPRRFRATPAQIIRPPTHLHIGGRSSALCGFAGGRSRAPSGLRCGFLSAAPAVWWSGGGDGHDEVGDAGDGVGGVSCSGTTTLVEYTVVRSGCFAEAKAEHGGGGDGTGDDSSAVLLLLLLQLQLQLLSLVDSTDPE